MSRHGTKVSSGDPLQGEFQAGDDEARRNWPKSACVFICAKNEKINE